MQGFCVILTDALHGWAAIDMAQHWVQVNTVKTMTYKIEFQYGFDCCWRALQADVPASFCI